MAMFMRLNWTVFLAVIAVSACGCSDTKQPASKIAARVNGGPISTHQINYVIARSNVAPDQAKQVTPQVLERIIDQELMAQKAHESRLDESPNVLQAIESE